MRIYIAGPWIERQNMPAIAARIEAAGHTITHKWWEAEDTKEGFEASHDILAQQAGWDLNGVRDADLVFLVNSQKSEGKSVEQGIALAADKPILAVGKLGEHSKNVFHYLSNYKWVDTIDDAMMVLSTIHWLLSKG